MSYIKKTKVGLLDFWKQTRITFFIVLALFIAGLLIGFIIPEAAKLWLLDIVFSKFADILQDADAVSTLGLRIFINNLIVTALLFISAVFIFPPVLILIFNGMIIGMFMDLSYQLDALNPGTLITTLLSMIPHGIFEIPAFILSAVFGVNLVIKLFFGSKALSKQKRKPAFIYYVRNYILIIIPLLLFAGLFEVTVSESVVKALDKHYQNKYIDKTLAVDLSKDFLIDYDCHTVSTTAEQAGYLAPSVLEMGGAIYDKQLQKIFRRNSRLPHWFDTYQCGQDYLRLIVYRQEEYPPDQHYANQLAIFKKLDFDVSELQPDIVLARSDTTKTYFSAIPHGSKTVALFWNGSNQKILKNIKF